MTQDDITRMAREAGLAEWHESIQQDGFRFAAPNRLERFAALVEQNLIASGYRKCAEGQKTTQFCALAEEVVRAEREACAKLCESGINADQYPTLTEVAAAIRARGTA